MTLDFNYCGATNPHPPHMWAEWRWCHGSVAPVPRRRTLDDVVNEEREAMRHEIQSGSYYGDEE